MACKFCQINKFDWVLDIAYIHEDMNSNVEAILCPQLCSLFCKVFQDLWDAKVFITSSKYLYIEIVLNSTDYFVYFNLFIVLF